MAIEEEFSIEIPDKEADAIHSGMDVLRMQRNLSSNNEQLTKPLLTSAPSPMLTKQCLLYGTEMEQNNSKGLYMNCGRK